MLRPRWSAKVTWIVATTLEMINASPIPCTTRAMMTTNGMEILPAVADAAANVASPIRNARLRPHRSPNFAPLTRNAASANGYPSMINGSSQLRGERSLLSAGSAVLRMVTSRPPRKTAQSSTVSVSHLPRSG